MIRTGPLHFHAERPQTTHPSRLIIPKTAPFSRPTSFPQPLSGAMQTSPPNRGTSLSPPPPAQAPRHTWPPDGETWPAIKRHSVEHPATVSITGSTEAAPDARVSGGRITLTTSK